ncbi:hypothetical protein F4824DRAFT_449385 [Ustulina deusta]|nr:hypothetical protein F4824DRAFT_449385 [Ustulina deusta]
MGWLWSSGVAPKGNAVDASTTTSETQSVPPQAPEPTYGDPEIAKFLAQLQADFGGNSNSTTPKPAAPSASADAPNPSASQPAPPSSSSSSWWPSWSTRSQPPAPPSPPSSSSLAQPTPQTTEPGRLDPVSESLLPTSMSCRQAFDHAFHCNSLGGQWTSVYRSGGVRSCSEQWDDFWFCMRTRAYSGPVKEAAVRDYYRQKELRKYGPGMPSSTDVWEPRPEKLPPGAAFQGRYEKPDISDEEWRRQEIERRRMIQRQLREEEERTASS